MKSKGATFVGLRAAVVPAGTVSCWNIPSLSISTLWGEIEDVMPSHFVAEVHPVDTIPVPLKSAPHHRYNLQRFQLGWLLITTLTSRKKKGGGSPSS